MALFSNRVLNLQTVLQYKFRQVVTTNWDSEIQKSKG